MITIISKIIKKLKGYFVQPHAPTTLGGINTELTPNELITSIRESFYGSTIVYTSGSCSKLYEILKLVFPQANMYSNIDHVITEIDGRFYDITGELTFDDVDYLDLSTFIKVSKYDNIDHRYTLNIDSDKGYRKLVNIRRNLLDGLDLSPIALNLDMELASLKHILYDNVYIPDVVINEVLKVYKINIQDITYNSLVYTY